MLLKSISLLLLLGISGIGTLAGVVNIAVGGLKKNRKVLKIGIMVFLLSIVLGASTVAYTLHKAYQRTEAADFKGLAKAAWVGFIDGLVGEMEESATAQAVTTPKEAFGKLTENPIPKEIKNVKGVWIETWLSWNGYFKYQAPKEAVFTFLRGTKIEKSALEPDMEPNGSGWEWTEEDFAVKKIQRHFPEWKPDQVAHKEIFEFTRFPWAHAVLFDSKTGTVYHVVEQILRD